MTSVQSLIYKSKRCHHIQARSLLAAGKESSRERPYQLSALNRLCSNDCGCNRYNKPDSSGASTQRELSQCLQPGEAQLLYSGIAKCCKNMPQFHSGLFPGLLLSQKLSKAMGGGKTLQMRQSVGLQWEENFSKICLPSRKLFNIPTVIIKIKWSSQWWYKNP